MEATDIDARIAAMDPTDPELRARSDAALARIIGRNGKLPTLANYRRVYDSLAKLGIDWPGTRDVPRRPVIGGNVLDPSALAAYVPGQSRYGLVASGCRSNRHRAVRAGTGDDRIPGGVPRGEPG